MIRLVVFLIAILAIASGLAWLADRPGSLVLTWQGYQIETSVFRAIVILTLALLAGTLVWSALRTVWMSPALLGRYMRKQRQRKGLDALSSGMIAISAGDRGSASRYAQQARKSLPNEPLTQLLRAQTAHLSGDRATAKRIYESMLSSRDTEVLGLRGLYLEAKEMDEPEAARHFAARALTANPALAWPVDATFKHQCQEENWIGALETLATARRFGHVDKATADRRRAVLLTAQAQILEDGQPEEALKLALEAHGLAKDLVPAAAIGGRLLASKGNTSKAAKVLQKTWALSPHPDLATAYAYARIGDSPNDRLERVKKLAASTQKSAEGPIAIAHAALEAREFDVARHALQPFLEDGLTQRIATLMARIEGEQHGDKGRIREWLARAITAGRDPVWTADGVISEQWAPVSPVTGELDAFAWRTPVERVPGQNTPSLTGKAEELIAVLAAASSQQPTIEAKSDPASDTPTGDPQPGAVVVSGEAKTAAPEPQDDASGPSDAGAAPGEPAQTAAPHANAESTSKSSRFGGYTAKISRKKNKKFQHTQASVAIKSEPSSKQRSAEATAPKPQTTKENVARTARDNADQFMSRPAPDDPGPKMSDQDGLIPGHKPFRTASS